jgi:DNA-binding HxlR family transcriptional regulator
VRAGAHGISLLGDTLDAQVLKVLEDGPHTLIDLRHALGSPPETTLRRHLKALTGMDILIRTREPRFPRPVSHQLSSSGRELLETAGALSAWLAAAPAEPLPLGSDGAESVIKALVDGWSAKIVRALAARALSLTALNRALSGVDYPALERRVAAMRTAGQIAPVPGRVGTSTPYRVTGWLREAIRPIASAALWEGRHRSDLCEPITRIDLEALLLLAIPLLGLAPRFRGSCRLVVEIPNGPDPATAGTVVTVERGRPVACRPDMRAPVASSVTGSAAIWLKALAGGEGVGFEVAGDRALGDAVVEGMVNLLPRDGGPPMELAAHHRVDDGRHGCAPGDRPHAVCREIPAE